MYLNEKELLVRADVINRLNIENLDLIATYLQSGASQIKSIFDTQVEQMKSIHCDVKNTRNILNEVKQDGSSSAILNDALSATDDILHRTDSVIKAMYSFVTALQCEDRIIQLLDGIRKVLENESAFLQVAANNIPQKTQEEIRHSCVQFYTIQEQRDIALGNRIEPVSCSGNASSSIDDFDLF